MADNNENGRRQFLKFTGLGALAAVLASKVVTHTSTATAADAAAKPLEMVKPTDPMAVSLGYIEDATKVDTKKWPKRAGEAGKKQFCYNCTFYQNKKDPKASKAAPCTIFTNKGVTSKGWCNSWTEDKSVKG